MFSGVEREAFRTSRCGVAEMMTGMPPNRGEYTAVFYKTNYLTAGGQITMTDTYPSAQTAQGLIFTCVRTRTQERENNAFEVSKWITFSAKINALNRFHSDPGLSLVK